MGRCGFAAPGFRVGGIAMLLSAVLLCAWTVFITTSRVTVTKERVVRAWQWGSHVIDMDKITKLQWSSARGQLNLVVRAGKQWIVLSSLSFTEQELHEIANTILAARGLKGCQSQGTAKINIMEMPRRFAGTEVRKS